MKVIDRLRKKMEAIGGSLDEYDNFFVLDAPTGYVWAANGDPAFTIRFRNVVGQTWLMEALREEKSSLDMGLYKVTDPQELLQIRHNVDDDSWGAPWEAPEIIYLPEGSL